MNNCHGCKWLDRYKSDGNGYCSMVTRSNTFKGAHVNNNGEVIPSSRVRKPHMARCELYKSGDFATRYNDKTEGTENSKMHLKGE